MTTTKRKVYSTLSFWVFVFVFFLRSRRVHPKKKFFSSSLFHPSSCFVLVNTFSFRWGGRERLSPCFVWPCRVVDDDAHSVNGMSLVVSDNCVWIKRHFHRGWLDFLLRLCLPFFVVGWLSIGSRQIGNIGFQLWLSSMRRIRNEWKVFFIILSFLQVHRQVCGLDRTDSRKKPIVILVSNGWQITTGAARIQPKRIWIRCAASSPTRPSLPFSPSHQFRRQQPKRNRRKNGVVQ